MNDDELITAVKASVTGVHMTIPAEQIMRRSSTIRARRRITGTAVALAVLAGAVVAATMLLPGRQHSHPVTAQLAAWTVIKQPGGNISITIRELRNPSGLQRTLRADGVPASVTFFNQQNAACQPYPYHPKQDPSEARWQTITQILPHGTIRHVMVIRPAFPPGNGLIIAPSTLPSGAGLQIGAGPAHHGFLPVWAELVQASQQCTGN